MKMRFGLGVLAYLAPTFALGFVWHLMLFKGYYERLAIYRKDIIIPFGFLAMLIQAFIFAWVYQQAFAQRNGSLLSRGVTYAAFRSRSLVELYDAGGRSQEPNDIGPGLPGYRDGIHGCAVDNGRAVDRARLCACATESNFYRIASSRVPAP